MNQKWVSRELSLSEAVAKLTAQLAHHRSACSNKQIIQIEWVTIGDPAF